MYRDVQWRQLLLIEPLPVMLLQIGQSDEISKQERVAIVIILDVERGTHAMCQTRLGCETFGQSFDKAEDTFIGALADKGSWLLAKEHAKVLVK